MSVFFSASRRYLLLKPISRSLPVMDTENSSFAFPNGVMHEILAWLLLKKHLIGLLSLSFITSEALSTLSMKSLVFTMSSVVLSEGIAEL